jgi:hypothetical protein
MTFQRGRGRTPRSRSLAPREGVLLLLLLGVLLVLAPALARAQAPDSLVLRWTAPSDPGAGAVSRYDLRVATTLITESSFAAASPLPAPAPGAPGTLERAVVRGLAAGHSYWFAIRSADASNNWSLISNVVRWDHTLDTAPPAAPSGLAEGAPVGGSVALHWAPGTEPDLAGYHVWRAVDPTAAWSNVSAGLLGDTTFVDTSLPAGFSKLWYAVSAVDFTGNESARSAALSVVLLSGDAARALGWRLAAAYPNPAHAGQVMHLPVEVPLSASDARLDILDAASQVVRRFPLSPGVTSTIRVDWDGTNEHGAPCAPGVYRAWLVAGDTRQFVRIARIP